jgi:hypothetical protein
MAAHNLHTAHHDQGDWLSPRRALRRAFGGMIAFFCFGLLGFGTYLIRDQFRDPVNSHPASLLFAAVLIATALVMFSYLLYPGDHRQRGHRAVNWPEVTTGRIIELQVHPERKPANDSTDIPLPARYVDTRIRL